MYYLTPPFCWKYFSELLWWRFLWSSLFASIYIVKSIHFKNTPVQISLQWNWCLAPLKRTINCLWKIVWYSQVLSAQNDFSEQCVFLFFIFFFFCRENLNCIKDYIGLKKKNNRWVYWEQETCYVYREKKKKSLSRQNYLTEVSWCRGTSILWTFTPSRARCHSCVKWVL